MTSKDKKAQTQSNYNANSNAKPWSVHTHFGKDGVTGTQYYTAFKKEEYLEYYWELLDYLRSITEIHPNDYHFAGMYFDEATGTTERMYDMSVHEDDTLSFDYTNVCVRFNRIRVKLKDAFKIFEKKGDALKFIQYCMRCFSTAAK